jgi:hypothetical protein
MGKINRYYQPAPQQFVSQFVPENIELMNQALQQRQAQSDQSQQSMDLIESELLKERALPEYDSEQLKSIEQEYKTFTEGLSQKDLADSNTRREINKYISNSRMDPRLQKIRSGVATKDAYDKLKAKYSEDEFKYAIENDPMAKAYQQYLTQTGDKKKFASEFITGMDTFQAGVDKYKNKERFFANISESGRESIQNLGEGDALTYYKTGATGKSSDKILAVAKSEFDDYLRSPGGQQETRNFRTMFPEEQVGEELWKDFLKTGMKREGMKYTTGKAGALNSSTQKQRDLDAKALLSVGNTSLSNLGVIGFDNQSNDNVSDPMILGAKMTGAMIMDFISEMDKPDGERFTGLNEGEWLSENFNKNAKLFASGSNNQMTNEDKQRFKTTAINFKNTMTDPQREGYSKLSKKQQGEKLQEYIKLMPKTSLELQGEAPLDPNRKAMLNELVTFNSAANAPVTPLDGESPEDQPTLDSYRQAGYKIVGRYVLKSNPVTPGERLAIVMEDASGNRARVSTKGALVLGDKVNEIIPSERNSSVSDNLQRQKFNYESDNFSIPINQNGQTIEGSIKDDSYNISLNAFGQTFNAKWYFNEGNVPYAKSDGNKAYAKYKDALDEISDIYNTNEPDETKAANVVKFLTGLSNQ